MRIRGPGIGILVALLMPVDSSLAVNQTVTREQPERASHPRTVTVSQGESVTWNNAGGFHNVRFDDDSFTQPVAPIRAWTVSRTFTSRGNLPLRLRGPWQAAGHVGHGHRAGDRHDPGARARAGAAAPVTADKIKPTLKLGGQATRRCCAGAR